MNRCISLALVLASGLVSGCISQTVPVRAVTNKDEVFTGAITATWGIGTNEGTVHAQTANGTSCDGTYDPLVLATQKAVMLYLSCSDGRHGTVKAVMDFPLSRRSGIGSGEWKDGTKITFAWGQERIDGMIK
jgi:hypothetical protein